MASAEPLPDALELATVRFPFRNSQPVTPVTSEQDLSSLDRPRTAWEYVLWTRHGRRPRMMDYVARLFDDFLEVHGDRQGGDDSAMVTGFARIAGRSVAIVGQQKGVTTEEKVRRNFGMASPEGYRKALRVFRLAERFGLPVISFVDTPAAYPGAEAETNGQGPAIAANLLEMARLNTPVFAVVIGEGGSGGALGIAVADRVAMLEYAVYMICPPERCAEILWRDAEQKEPAANALRVSAADLRQFGVVDVIIPEPPGGAHRFPDEAIDATGHEIIRFLEDAENGSFSVELRRKRLREFGRFALTVQRGRK
ncbi:MAG TPA: acetyl-CoA carboxylase carboxyl transferase subunit alpha [Candidatus Hydrogenedentes bacterium]|mgnify:FL=1|nr:acetyl-CoA carboxylase carboxyl transferase subunit alpha [Candidatus Hydrogenedentota bacterium]